METNYVGLLNERAQKKGWSVQYELVQIDGPDHIKTFTMRAVMNNQCYPEGVGQNKKEAKQNAAKSALSVLENDEPFNTVFNENSSGEENPNTSNLRVSLHQLRLSTPPPSENTTGDRNYIGLLNEFCQRSKQVPRFQEVERRGPAHDPEFVYKVIINEKEYPEGQGKSVKEAKQKAAQQAWTQLCESDFKSQLSIYQMSSPSSVSELTDDVSLLQKSSKNHSKSESIVFASLSSVPELQPQPSDVKPRRRLAANFQNSPGSIKKEYNANALKMAKPSTESTTVSNHSTKSRFLEEFDSINRIGKGGFGRVYKARRKLENTNFAVKIVKFNKNARREVSTLSRLGHANIVRYHTSWTEETAYRDEASESSTSLSSSSGSEFLYIQMEFCEGETLCEWIEERNRQPKKCPKRRQEAAKIIKQVLEAVKYIHLKNLFHRDLKPANIMFGHEGVVKVGDFGLVTTEEVDEDGSLLEHTKRAGTRSYMSPEQRQKQGYDRKVDIYAMGLIYFELLWRFGTQTERQKQWNNIRSKAFPDMFSKTFNFEHKLIEQMLCEKPERRPEASNLLTDLEQHSATTASTEYKEHKENRTY